MSQDLIMPSSLTYESSSIRWMEYVEPMFDINEGTILAEAGERRDNEVERIGDEECRLYTSLSTPYPGRQSATGTMFTVVPLTEIEVLGFEFDFTDDAPALDCEVYVRKGGFLEFFNTPDEWTRLASSIAQPAPDGVGAIIPTNDFTALTLLPGEVYSFYVTTKGPYMRLKPSDNAAQDFWQGDQNLEIQVGVGLNSYPFPEQLAAAGEFYGVVHYRVVRQCDDLRSTTFATLEFAVDSDATQDVIDNLNTAVQNAMQAIVVLNTSLIRFQKFHDLEIDTVSSSFQGRSQEKCPTEYEKCSLIHSKVTLSHAPTIESGSLIYEILTVGDQIGDSVVTQSDIDVTFIGDPLTYEDFVITLKGVPASANMNALQRRYFERITTNFLQEFADMTVYQIDVTDEVIAGSDSDSTAASSSSTNSRSLLRLRGSHRKLQSTAVSQIVTTVTGAGTPADFRTNIIETFAENNIRYTLELSRQQLRPGEINELNSGSYFHDLFGTSVMVKPENFGEPEPTLPPEAVQEGGGNLLYIILCAAAIGLSVIWLTFQCYKDCKREKLKPPKLGKKRKKGSNPELSEGPPPRSYDPIVDRAGDEPRMALRRSSSFGDVPRSMNRFESSGHNRSGSYHRRPSFDGLTRPQRRPSNEGSSRRGREPTRGMQRSRSFDPAPRARSRSQDRGSRRNPSDHTPSNQGSRHRSEPIRGVSRSRSLDPGPRKPRSFGGHSAHDRTLGHSNHSRGSRGRPVSEHIRKPRSADFSGHNRTTRRPSNDDKPRNRAGENGRGVTATRSLPTALKRSNPGAPSRPVELEWDSSSSESESGTADKMSNLRKNSRLAAAKNRAGDKRGVSSSLSMPVSRANSGDGSVRSRGSRGERPTGRSGDQSPSGSRHNPRPRSDDFDSSRNRAGERGRLVGRSASGDAAVLRHMQANSKNQSGMNGRGIKSNVSLPVSKQGNGENFSSLTRSKNTGGKKNSSGIDFSDSEADSIDSMPVNGATPAKSKRPGSKPIVPNIHSAEWESSDDEEEKKNQIPGTSNRSSSNSQNKRQERAGVPKTKTERKESTSGETATTSSSSHSQQQKGPRSKGRRSPAPPKSKKAPGMSPAQSNKKTLRGDKVPNNKNGEAAAPKKPNRTKRPPKADGEPANSTQATGKTRLGKDGKPLSKTKKGRPNTAGNTPGENGSDKSANTQPRSPGMKKKKGAPAKKPQGKRPPAKRKGPTASAGAKAENDE